MLRFACAVAALIAVTDSAQVLAGSEPVTPIADVRRGSMVMIEGVVKRITDSDEFVIADETGKIRVDVRYPNFVPVNVGESVKVRGFVDRDLIREVYAKEILHADGRISRLDRTVTSY